MSKTPEPGGQGLRDAPPGPGKKTPAELTPEEARNALVFLSRTDLKGIEVDAYLAVRIKLQLIASPPPG